MFCFPYGKEAAGRLNITEIKRDDVVLKPGLIFKKKK
jgi:hypothetical protein